MRFHHDAKYGVFLLIQSNNTDESAQSRQQLITIVAHKHLLD